LSGDGFESLCDFSAHSPKENLVNRTEIESAKSIFCTSHNLEKLIQNYGDLIQAEVLFLGNSDRDFYEFNLELPNSIKKVFLQNSHISNDFFKTLPIGLENLRLARNGVPSLFDSSHASSEKQNKILVGPFSPTHAERDEIHKWSSIKHDLMTYSEGYLSPSKLSKLSSGYLFVACPRGNGTDTHRFWETLYRGSIPVVKRTKWSDSLKSLDIPFIELSSWDYEEFLGVTENHLLQPIDPVQIESLWIHHWKKLLS
jgi:hypothetical protein